MVRIRSPRATSTVGRGTRRRLRGAAAVLALGLCATGLADSPSQAVLPGVNGRIAVTYESPYGGCEDCGGGQPDYLIATMDTDGSDFQTLPGQSRYEAAWGSPDWSPDGTLLAYGGAACDDCASKIIRTRLDGSHRKVLEKGRSFDSSHWVDVGSPTWSPNGRRIAYIRRTHRGSDLFVMRRDGSHAHRLTRLGDIAGLGDWSGQGRLLFARHLGKTPTSRELFTIRYDGGRLHRVTHNATVESSATWAPDGHGLVYVDQPSRFAPGVVTVLVDGTATTVGPGSGPAWSPDGTLIAYMAPDHTLHTVTPSGTEDAAYPNPNPFPGRWVGSLDWQSIPEGSG